MPPVDVAPADHPWAAAILLHPHPARGGDRFNHVVDRLYRDLPPAGVTAVRFDFTSSDPAVAAAQVVAALDGTATRPVVLVGYSFGADVATTVTDDRLAGWFLVAPPLSVVPADQMAVATDRRPKALAVAERDQFSPPDRVAQLTAGWRATTVATVPAADHFLAGGTQEVVRQVLAWLHSLPVGAGGAGGGGGGAAGFDG